METVEGAIVFRNRMGKTTLIKVETADKETRTLCFTRESLGDPEYEVVGRLDLDERIRAEVVPAPKAWREPGVVDVRSFQRV